MTYKLERFVEAQDAVYAGVLDELRRGRKIRSATGGQKLGIAYWKPFNPPDVAALTELLEAGKIRPVIDRRYPLAEVPDALRYVEDGHALGKVVITV